MRMRWWVAVLMAAGVLVVPSSQAVSQAASVSCPVLVSHRTGPLLAPENTVPGIHASAGAGASVVEVDVRWSKSSYPVLMHDTTVDRTTDGSGVVADMWLGDLTSLWAADYAPWSTDPAYASTMVPYGWDFMNAEAQADVDVLLDIKVSPTQLMAEKLVYYVDWFSWRDRTVFMGSAAAVTAMRQWYPTLRYAQIEYNPRSGGITQQIRTGESLQALGVAAYAVPARDITPAAVTYWRSYGLDVYTWTTDNGWDDSPVEWARVADAGVDQLITDDPVGAVAWATARGC